MSAEAVHDPFGLHLQRAQLLLESGRNEHALEEFVQALALDPNAAFVHGMMAACLLNLGRLAEARQQAERAVQLEPDLAFGYQMLTLVQLEQGSIALAEDSAKTALAIDNQSPRNWANLARVHFHRDEYDAMLAATEQGLRLDPEDEGLTSLRSVALMNLGQLGRADQTLTEILSRNPEDAHSHAALGWSRLSQGRAAEAQQSFRAALMIDPDQNWARKGLIHSIKATHPLYRPLFGASLWLARQSAEAQYGLVISGFFLAAILGGPVRDVPLLEPFALPLLVFIVGTFTLGWLFEPASDLLLLSDPLGRQILTPEQRNRSALIAACIFPAAVCLALAIVYRSPPWSWLALVCGLLALPAAGIYRFRPGGPRVAMAALTLGLGILGLAAGLGPLLTNRLDPTSTALGACFLFLLTGVSIWAYSSAIAKACQ